MIYFNGEDGYMDDIDQIISSADGADIEEILRLVLHRYGELYPRWEIGIVSMEKGKNRIDQLDAMIAALERLKAQ